MRILRAGDYKKMPWKNGGGVTTEIAIFPPAAGLADFDWRVSMATVAEDGPFSAFSGIDRRLSIIDGSGMQLSVTGRDAVLLDQSSEPYGFDGEADCSAVLTAGPIVDLNVMARRGRIVSSVRRVQAGEPIVFQARDNLLLCHRGDLDLEANGISHRLEALDCLVHEGPDAFTGMLSGNGTAFLIGFDPA
jgi:environmental stress-induced protein Ves